MTDDVLPSLDEGSEPGPRSVTLDGPAGSDGVEVILGTVDTQPEARRYRVTVENLTGGQPFTPPAVAAHDSSVEVFSVGSEANEPTREIAENGNLDPLVGFVEDTDAVDAAAVGDAPLVPRSDPGGTGRPSRAVAQFSTTAGFLSVISMLIATNDGFTGLDTVRLPPAVGESKTLYAGSYDAGTERNTERFEDMVPPAQGLMGVDYEADGTATSDPALAEGGVVTPHPGITGGVGGDGQLSPELFGWSDPAAAVTVERVPDDPPVVPRFDFDGDGEVGLDDVLETITAFNTGREVGGEPVTLDDVLSVITAFNAG